MDQHIRHHKGGLNPRKLDGRNGFLQVGEAAEQLGDVVGGEKAPVALQKGRGIPIGIIEEFLEGVIPPGHGLATIGLKGRPSYPLGAQPAGKDLRKWIKAIAIDQQINGSGGIKAFRGGAGQLLKQVFFGAIPGTAPGQLGQGPLKISGELTAPKVDHCLWVAALKGSEQGDGDNKIANLVGTQQGYVRFAAQVVAVVTLQHQSLRERNCETLS